MTEPHSEGDRAVSQPSATTGSYRLPTVANIDAVTRARRTSKPTIVADRSSGGSPQYVPRAAATLAQRAREATAERPGAADAIAGRAATESAPAPAASTEPTAVPMPASRPKPATSRMRRTRKARLRIARVDPWSVMKTSLLFGIAGGIILVVATYVVMSVIESTGVYQAINQVVGSMLSSPTDTTPFSIETYVNTRRVTGLAALIGAVDVVIFTALATVFSFLYNLSATMLGGLEITLAED